MGTRKNVFSFSDDEDENEKLINSVQPLPSNAVERSAFTAQEFDPDTFLSSRRHLGLERMKTELNTHLKLLKSELVELINRDYQDFINLSTDLKGVDREINDLKTPLSSMESQVQQVRDHFQSVIQSLETKLQTRAQLRDKKAVLKLLLNIHESVTKVEDLLGINTDTVKPVLGQDEAVIVDDSLGKQIERVAIEYNQMQHLVRRGKHLAFVTENEWRITRIKDTLEHKLSKALSAALNQIRLGEVNKATKQSLVQCLRTYALIDQATIAEKIIRETFVRPALAKIITPKAVEGARNYGSPTLHDYPLTTMYQRILTFASTDLQPISDIVQKTLKGSNYDILVNTLWLETTEKINKECKSIFAAGQTDIFHKNYSATISFISSLEGLCSSKRSLLCLRNHPSYTEFLKRWQLPVYFQLRFREIIKDVEHVLGDVNQGLVMQKSTDNAILAGTNAILNAVGQCWSDQVFLYGLSHRFWKLTLQLIKRYNGWALGMIDYLNSEKTSATITKTASESTEFLIILRHDINSLTSKIKVQTNSLILPKLPSNIQDLPLFKESIEDALSYLEEDMESKITTSITNRISLTNAENLKLVKSMTNQYRHSNKSEPKEPSYFIPKLFNPVHELIQIYRNTANKEVDPLWIKSIVDLIIQEYAATVNDLLSNLNKSEESLKKSKNTKGQLSDEDKIRLQLYLDVEQVGAELKNIKIDTADIDSYPTLLQTVKPYSKK
ncbi:Conserved oligomeric Golgi complex subunit 2 [Rhizopus stolonifer]|uniref:Conserved oligomeric Golgi complex subunit 2 n=1 Tax=Rhizopus stolonifer TaxID=4846 RepID=A0A367KGL2_RHIST|nr:Conserved oligomeric Golgi complex subunit 2 [Rhizopus stolonifer]